MQDIRIERIDRGWTVRLYVDGERLSGLIVFDFQIRIEDQVLPMGGIAGVHTDSRARGKGYASQVMRRSLELMREEGMALSVLYGIDDFYHRWGFRTALLQPDVQIRTRDLERHLDGIGSPVEIRHRPAEEADLAGILELYELANRGRTGTLVRRPPTWTGFRRGSGFGRQCIVEVFEAAGGELAGYVVVDRDIGDELLVSELVCRDWTDLPSLAGMLRFLAEQAAQRRNGWIRFYIPPDYPLTDYLKRIGMQQRAQYAGNGGPMVRIIDLERTMQAMLPLFQRRLECSRYASRRLGLSIRTDIGTAVLEWDGAQVRVSCSGGVLEGGDDHPVTECTQDVLAAALLGYMPGEAIALFGGRVPSEAAAVTVLFPRQHPFMWYSDKF